MPVISKIKNVRHYCKGGLFWRNRSNLGVVRNICKTVPGHLRMVEGLFLFEQASKVAAGGAVVEIGSYFGRSTAFLAAALSRFSATSQVFAIDPFRPEGVLEKFQRNISVYGDTVVVHEAYSYDVAMEWDRSVDLLWIDGDHTYEGCVRDIEDWLPYVRRGGLVAFHDYINPCGVKDAVDTVFRPFERVGSTGLVGSIYYGEKA